MPSWEYMSRDETLDDILGVHDKKWRELYGLSERELEVVVNGDCLVNAACDKCPIHRLCRKHTGPEIEKEAEKALQKKKRFG
jgi:hypothetical protein